MKPLRLPRIRSWTVDDAAWAVVTIMREQTPDAYRAYRLPWTLRFARRLCWLAAAAELPLSATAPETLRPFVALIETRTWLHTDVVPEPWDTIASRAIELCHGTRCH